MHQAYWQNTRCQIEVKWHGHVSVGYDESQSEPLTGFVCFVGRSESITICYHVACHPITYFPQGSSLARYLFCNCTLSLIRQQTVVSSEDQSTQAYRLRGRQADRQTDEWINRQTIRQTDHKRDNDRILHTGCGCVFIVKIDPTCT